MTDEEALAYISRELFYTCVEMQRVCLLFNQANDKFLEETSTREPQRKLLRVAWLQHRGACLALLIAFVAFVVAIVVERSRVDASYAAFVAGGCVDCLQADVTRCGGITGVLQVGSLCATHQLDLSGHCAPAVTAHALCGVHPARHLEYFFDHVRIESMAFDGTLQPDGGFLEPDRTRPGLGLELRRKDLERYRVL